MSKYPAFLIFGLLALIGCIFSHNILSNTCNCLEDNGNGSMAEPNKLHQDDRITFLKKCGFVSSDDEQWVISSTKIGEILSKLGLKITDLYPTLSQPRFSDVRTATKNGIHFIFESQMKGENGFIVNNSLNDENSLCFVRAVYIRISEVKE